MFLRALLFFFVFVSAVEAASRVEIARRGVFSDSALVEGRDGAIYGWRHPGKIFRFSPDGQFRFICDLGGERFIQSIAAGADGQLYVVVENGELYRVSYSGVPQKVWSSAEWAGFSFNWVTELDENVYGFTYNSVFRLSPDGSFTVLAAISGFGAGAMAAGSDGALWVAGWDEQSQPCIRRVWPDGTVDNPITSGALPGAVRRLVSHPDGSLAAVVPLSTFGWALMRITPKGEITQVGAFPSEPPTELSIGNNGRFIVKSWDPTLDWSFRAVDRDGSVETLATVPRSMHFSLEYGGLVATHDGRLFAVAQGPWVGETVKPGALLRVRVPGQVRNAPPLARSDFRRPPAPGEGMWINVLSNDSDLDRDPLILTTVDQPSHGTVTNDLARGGIYYTAPVGAPVLADEFLYHISDGKGGVAVGRVVIRPNLRGTFASLLESESPEENGRISVTLGNFGALSAQIWLGGRRDSFVGRLDANNRFALERGAGPDSGMSLRLELLADASGHPVIDAEIETSRGKFEAQLLRPSLPAAAQVAGAYTFVLPSDPAWKTEPEYIGGFNIPLRRNPIYGVQGSGFGYLRVQASGLCTIWGVLPDGVPFTAGQVLDRAGRLPLFATFNARNSSRDEERKGWITGRLAFGNVAGVSDAAGSARWIQPWAITASSQTGSFFERGVDVIAARYTAPRDLQSTFGNGARVVAKEGGLTATISASAQVSGDALAGMHPMRINGSFVPATGLIGGNVSFPGWGAWTSYRGVQLQKQGRMIGHFKSLTGRGTGQLEMQSQ